jgi:hypothetical protein
MDVNKEINPGILVSTINAIISSATSAMTVPLLEATTGGSQSSGIAIRGGFPYDGAI